jgi:DNA-binding NtrC family response regulator
MKTMALSGTAEKAVGNAPGRVLVVTHRCPDYERLETLFACSTWHASCAHSVAEARASLAADPGIGVILCEAALPDGTWRDVLAARGKGADAPLVIVISRTADDALWNEVLAGGGYDVVPIPFDAKEVFRIVTLAWKHRRLHASR